MGSLRRKAHARTRRAAWAAGAVSVLIHGTLLWAAVHVHAPPRKRPKLRWIPMELELLEPSSPRQAEGVRARDAHVSAPVTRPSRVPPLRPPPNAVPATRPTRAPNPTPSAPSATSGTSTASTMGAPSAPDVTDASAVRTAPTASSPVNSNGPSSADGNRAAFARAAGWDLRGSPAPAGSAGRGAAALNAYLADSIGRDNVEAGDVDGWYGALRTRIRSRWQPDIERARAQWQRRMRPLARVIDTFNRYAGGPERPIDPPGQPPPEVSAPGGAEHGERVAIANYMDAMNLLNAPTRWHRVEVHAIHAPTGAVHNAWVTRSSGSAELDDTAIVAVRAAADELPPPPARVTTQRDWFSSDWALEAGEASTYLGQGGCVGGPGDVGTQCVSPLGGTLLRTRIVLLRVVDGVHDGPTEHKASRHAAPSRAAKG